MDKETYRRLKTLPAHFLTWLSKSVQHHPDEASPYVPQHNTKVTDLQRLITGVFWSRKQFTVWWWLIMTCSSCDDVIRRWTDKWRQWRRRTRHDAIYQLWCLFIRRQCWPLQQYSYYWSQVIISVSNHHKWQKQNSLTVCASCNVSKMNCFLKVVRYRHWTRALAQCTHCQGQIVEKCFMLPDWFTVGWTIYGKFWYQLSGKPFSTVINQYCGEGVFSA